MAKISKTYKQIQKHIKIVGNHRLNGTGFQLSVFELVTWKSNENEQWGIYRNQGADFVKNYSKKTPSARMAKVEEIVNSIIFLLDQGSSYINGHNLVVDGGWTIW